MTGNDKNEAGGVAVGVVSDLPGGVYVGCGTFAPITDMYEPAPDWEGLRKELLEAGIKLPPEGEESNFESKDSDLSLEEKKHLAIEIVENLNKVIQKYGLESFAVTFSEERVQIEFKHYNMDIHYDKTYDLREMLQRMLPIDVETRLPPHIPDYLDGSQRIT